MIYRNFRENSMTSIIEEYLKAARGDGSEVFKFPSEEIQVITNGLKGDETAKSALQIFKTLDEIIKSEDFSLQSTSNILDYGCGWGRITRLLATFVEDRNVFGVDVDSRLISAAVDFVRSINFKVIESMGMLPFENNFFDLIFANSVFSHLSENSAISTLAELQRILSPNGLLIISVLEKNQMDKFYSNPKQKNWIEKVLGNSESANKTLSETGFVWGDTKRWDNYGIAIMNDEWLTKTLSSLNAKLISSTRTKSEGSQNYKAIRKN